MRARRLREVLEAACAWAREARGRVTVLLYGSYARGDFNVWSDVDVIVVSEAFEGVPFTRRWRLLPRTDLPLEAIAWTPREAEIMHSKPSWRRALSHYMVLVDDYGLALPGCRPACG